MTCACGTTYADPVHRCYHPDVYNGGIGSAGDPNEKCAADQLATLAIVDFGVVPDSGNVVASPGDELIVNWTYQNPTVHVVETASTLGIEDAAIRVTAGFGQPPPIDDGDDDEDDDIEMPWPRMETCDEEDKERNIGDLALRSYTIQVLCEEFTFVGNTSVPNLVIQ